MASTLAHDVINPSIGMASLAQGDIDFTQHYLGGDGRIPPDEVLRVVSHFQDFARIVQDHASGVERLAADMMKSISAGRLVLAPRTISVHDVVSGIQRPLEERAKTAGINLSVDVPADLPQVIADEPKTEQIIQNLVGNAFKFTDRGGTVKVVARPVGREEVVVRVEDTGRGIPPDKQLTVFEPRVQVSPEDSQRGYGLGLAIVKRLVEVQGGRIELASTVGVGSTFSFTLPVVDSPKAKEILGQKDFIDLRQMLGKFDRGQKEGFLMKRFGVNAEVAVPASELLIGVEDNQQNWEAIEKVMIDLFKSKDRFGIPAGGRILLSAGVENGSPFVRMEVARQRPEKPVDDITGRWRHNLSGIQSSIEVEESDTEFSATIRLPRI